MKKPTQKKTDLIYSSLSGLIWFDRLSLDRQGEICIAIAERLTLAECNDRLVVWEEAKYVS
jgi:hypothetical protein